MTETFNAEQCTSCDAIWQEEDLVRVYECGTCGTLSDERRCEMCNKFMGRADEDGCPDCLTPTVTVETIIDHDGALILAEEYDPDGPSKKDRDAQNAAIAKDAQQSAQAARWDADRMAASPTPWSQIEAGVSLHGDGPDTTLGVDRPITVHRVCSRPDGKIVAITTTWGEPRIEVHTPDEVAFVLPGPAQDWSPAQVTFTHAEHTGLLSSPTSPETLHVAVSQARSGDQWYPVLGLTQGRQVLKPLGQWIDPAQAARDLNVWWQVAQDLADAQGVALAPESASGTVHTEPTQWTTLGAALTSPVTITLGEDPHRFHAHVGPVVDVTVGRNRATLTDPHTLAAAVIAARTMLSHLTLTPTG